MNRVSYLYCMKILMVCLGNICRSPLAEGILAKKIESNRLLHEVDSAGTADYHIGSKPDPRSIAIGKEYGIDLSKLRGRQFTVNDFDAFDKILVMDKSNLQNVLRLARNQDDRKKVDLIRNCSNPGKDLEVPDPYYGGPEGFKDVYNMLDEAIDALLAQHNH